MVRVFTDCVYPLSSLCHRKQGYIRILKTGHNSGRFWLGLTQIGYATSTCHWNHYNKFHLDDLKLWDNISPTERLLSGQTNRLLTPVFRIFQNVKFVRVSSLIGWYFCNMHIVKTFEIVFSFHVKDNNIFPCLHKTVNVVIFFVKSNEITNPKGRALMQMYVIVSQLKREKRSVTRLICSKYYYDNLTVGVKQLKQHFTNRPAAHYTDRLLTPVHPPHLISLIEGILKTPTPLLTLEAC